MNKISGQNTVNIEGVDYLIDNLSKNAKLQIDNILFSDDKINQLQNELAISNTARAGYLKMLKMSSVNTAQPNEK